MNAPPAAQLRLLDLQAADSDLDRLAHRRRTLPELAEIGRLDARLAQLRDEIVVAETDDADLAREQAKLEREVDLVRSRSDRDRQRLDAGAVGSPRELENLQSEIISLARRQDDLEERVLELMERREAVQANLGRRVVEQDSLARERVAAAERRDAAYADIDAAVEKRSAERAELAAGIPADLLALYEKIRADRGRVGAAALHRGRCEGCHLSLYGQHLAQIRAAPPDLVVRCDECRRILVRTPDSGL